MFSLKKIMIFNRVTTTLPTQMEDTTTRIVEGPGTSMMDMATAFTTGTKYTYRTFHYWLNSVDQKDPRALEERGTKPPTITRTTRATPGLRAARTDRRKVQLCPVFLHYRI